MNHKDKLKLARKMMSPQEIKAHISPFQSRAWEAKKEATERRVAKREKNRGKEKEGGED